MIMNVVYIRIIILDLLHKFRIRIVTYVILAMKCEHRLELLKLYKLELLDLLHLLYKIELLYL